jgi:carbon-monoxide dehydrogenase large subunit
VTALTGLTDQGQGMGTALAQIVAGELGIAVEDVAVVAGDTAVAPFGGGTWASRGMPIGGGATLLAARALAERIRRLAGALLEAAPEDVDLGRGRAAVRGSPDRSLTLRELARAVHFRSSEVKGQEPSLEVTVHFTNPAPWTFTNGAHLAVVEVDADTGAVGVLRYVAVDDCGRVVNPALAAAQTHGGIAQGIGGALGERCAYDEAGQLVTATLMEYALPRAASLPPMEVHHLESPAPTIPGGFKGAGEAGTTGAPAAILNAVNDALAPLGAMLTEQPITSEAVWRAIQEARRAVADRAAGGVS